MTFEYTVFNSKNAGSLYLNEYGTHGWVFEPTGWDGGVYSLVYKTKAEAESAAAEWAAQMEWNVKEFVMSAYTY